MMMVGNQVRNYYELTKPKIWYLLVFTAFAAALTASLLFDVYVSPLTWVLIIGGVAAGSAAAALRDHRGHGRRALTTVI